MKPQFPKNKWFYAFVIALAVALVATVVAIVIGVANRAPEYVEGDEIGVYYYDVAEGEVLLTLSGGNKFTIVGPGINKTGTYTVEGTTLTLDFVKDEDGTTTATVDGEKVTLTYDNATMMFIKKTDYTVSFNVNGGSEIAAVKVVNGKTVAKPADPTKENAVFLGWYADEALTTPYSFDTVIIKADTTIYARWAEKTFGVAESVIDFDLGYEGATALAPITTISGKAYDVATPEREGYTFGGWWISMYEDGTKLSYAYTEDTVFTADTTLFAVWYDNASTKLNAPAVSVTGNTIAWNAVDGASAYKLTVVDPEGNTLIDNETVGATMKAFDFATQNAGEYKVSVIAVANNEENNSEPTERYYANKALDRVSQFQVVNGILVFGAVENAQKYLITIDCGNDKHVHTAFDNGSSTTYHLANCAMQQGGILITVTATADGYAPSTSKVFAYDLTLDQVGEIVYDAANDAFVWEAVENAVNYIVTVTAGGKTYTYDNGAATVFSTAAFSGDITVEVVPATQGYNSPAAATASCNKISPAAPSGITVSGMVISWNAVEGATSYEVKIGDNIATVTTNSINLADATTVTLNQGQNYSVSVKAINADNESSAYSKAVNVGYFYMNTELTYAQNTVYWAPVLGVTQYQVRVNGGKAVTVENANSAKVTLTQEGENLIEVCYVYADTTSTWASVTVTAHAVEYDSRSLESGSFLVEYLAVGDVMTLPETGFTYDGFDFVGWYNVPKGAAGNGVQYLEGATFQGNAYTIVYAEWTPKTYNVTLNTNGYDITNIENGQKEPAVYTKDFTLTVPEMEDSGMYFFAGWFTGPSGTGVQITDENGVCVKSYSYTRDITVYPYYSTDALEFVLQADGTYGVKKGTAIGSVTNLIIPVTYNEIPVTVVLESGFSSCDNLITVSIPDTIKLVGVNAFQTADFLEAINIYVAKPGETYETIYSSDNGVLLREDMGTTYIEIAPRGMKGTYVIPANVEKILTKAFYYTGIEKIVIPDTLLSIPKYAFYHCDSLKTVEFAMGRTNPLEMESYAFCYCAAVESITLPANLNMDVAAMKSVLDQFTGLKSVVIEEGGENFSSLGGMLTDKDKTTIYYCPKAYAGDISIPAGVTTIYEKAFYGCKQITSVTIPVWVTSIGNQAFYDCYAIESVVFKGSRMENLSIGNNAFAYNHKLKTVTFEGNGNFEEGGSLELDSGVVTMGTSVFYTSTPSSTTPKPASLTKVEIQAGVNIDAIGTSAFANQQLLTEFVVDDNAYVGAIGATAFKGCTRLTTFTVPATVASVGEKAFENCTNLTTVLFKEGGEKLTIANYAFMNCEKMASITIPKHLTSFNYTAFSGCDSLKKIVAVDNPHYLNDENGVLYGYETKDGTKVLTDLVFYPKGLVRENNGIINNLPSTLTSIGGSAFAENKYLVEVTIPKSVTSIGVAAFGDCTNLAKVHFAEAADGEELTLVIGETAFYACKSLSDDFVLPSYTTEIGINAFRECGFTKFTIPAKVTKIQYGAFAHCENLKTVIFNCEGALEIVNGSSYATANAKLGAFAYCDSLESVTFPAGLTSIGNYTFVESHALKTVTFTPKADGTYNLKTIGTYAFYRCYAFEEIFIPNTVETVGNYAFSMQSGTPGALKTVTFQLGGDAPLTLGTYLFQHNPELTTLTIPARVTQIAGKKEITASNVGTSKISSFNQMFTNCTGLAEVNIAVEEGITSVYSSLDGVLYNKDKTVLLYCPIANVGVYENGEPTYEIVVPTSVKVVVNMAFYTNTKLQTVTFAEFDKSDANYGKQLLTIGNYNKTGTSSFSSQSTYAAIGGATSSITTINLPSHLSTIKPAVFANEGDLPVEININPDAKNIVLERNAFGYANVTSISIPGIKSMGVYLFEACDFLESVDLDIPTSIKSLPNHMFYKCPALKSFEIPEHVTSIGTHSFYNNTALKSMTIPANVATLGNNAFYGCSALETVTFAQGSKIKKIDNQTFYNCQALANINIEDLALTSIGNSAFYQCYALTEIDFTRFTALTSIGTYAFRGMSLVNADLSKTKMTALSTSFYNNGALKTMVLPETLTKFDKNSFVGVTSLETITIASENFDPTTLYALANTNATIIYPETNNKFALDEFGVAYDNTEMPQTIYAAGIAKDLTGYTIPETVITIVDYAFWYAEMDSLEIPESVQTIGKYAFAYSEIPYVVFPSTVTVMNQYVFAYSGLQYIEFRNEHQSALTKIDSFAFIESDIVEFIMPDTVTEIGNSVFMRCYDFKKLVVGASLKKIYNQGSSGHSCVIISDCFALEELIFQEGNEEIGALHASTGVVGEQDDDKLNGVKTLVIPSTVKIIEKGAFSLFTGLETLTFAEGSQLETIGEEAFHRCYSLKSIVLPESVTSLGNNAFENCTSLESADLEATQIKDILEETFFNTAKLASLKLPAEVETIGDFAFYKAGVVDLYIPESVTDIGVSAFEFCTSMKTLTFSPDNKMEALGSLTEDTNIFGCATNLETIVLSNNLITIGSYVFAESGVKDVKMANEEERSQIQFIGNYAFADCRNLESFDHLENVVEIGDYAFLNCDLRADADAFTADLEGLVSMGAMAFGFNTNLPVGYIPASVTLLNGNPYAGLDKSKLVVAEGSEVMELVTDENGVVILLDFDKVTVYGMYGLTGAYELNSARYTYKEGAIAGNAVTAVTGIDHLKEIPSAMFMNCSTLESITLGEDVTAIGDYAFFGTALSSITIPEDVTTIGNYAFAECDALNNVVIPAGVTTLGRYCFAYCDILSDFTFEESTSYQQLGDHFFYNCVSITEVIVPSKPKISYDDAKSYDNGSNYNGALPAYMFAGTGIVNAYIPRQVTYFYTDRLFAGCKNLEAVTFEYDYATISNSLYYPMNPTAFDGCDKFQRVAYVENITNGYIGIVRYLYKWEINDLHFINSIKSEGTAALPNYPSLQYAPEELNLYFDADTYTDLIEYFSTLNRGWDCNVFDKDGNQLFGDNLGHIVLVKDANGNVIWEAQ